MNYLKKNDIMIIAQNYVILQTKMITIKTFKAIVLRQTDKTIYN